MITLIVTVLGGWLVLTVVGLAVLAPLRGGFRNAWLPAAPLLGACTVAIVLSATSWFVTTGWGMLGVSAVAAGCVTVAAFRKRRFWVYRRNSLAIAGLSWLIGAGGAALALIPNFLVGDGRVISVNQSHDAFYYAAESAWLADHLLLPAPAVGATPGASAFVPAFGPAAASADLSLRIGQPMVQSGITRLFGTDEINTTMPTLALWVLLLAGAVVVAGRLLRIRLSTCLGLAVASVTSAVLINQVYSQNADSLLGVALAVGTVGAVVGAAQGRSPRWPAALALAGLIAVYTEYSAFVAPAVIGGVLLHRSPRYRTIVLRAVQIFIVSLAIAPTVWLRGVRSILTAPASGFDAVPSPFAADGAWATASRALGVATIDGPTGPSRSTMLLGLILGAGCLLAAVVGRNRGVWIGLLVVGVGYTTWLTVQGRGYTQMRAVILLIPLLLLACAAGWDGLIGVLRRHERSKRWGRVVSWVLIPVLLLWVGVNLRTVRAQVNRVVIQTRHVDADYNEAAAWVTEFGGPEGGDVTVVVPDFFQQLWINFSLREDEGVSYPMLSTSYLRVGRYWAGEADRYLLVGAGAQVDADPSAVIRSNGKFRLLDTAAGSVTVVAPYDLSTWLPFAQPGGVFLGGFGSELLVIRSSGAPVDLRISLAAPLATAPVSAQLVGADGRTFPAELAPTGREIPVTVTDSSDETLTIEPAPGTPPDPVQIQLLGVTDGG